MTQTEPQALLRHTYELNREDARRMIALSEKTGDQDLLERARKDLATWDEKLKAWERKYSG